MRLSHGTLIVTGGICLWVISGLNRCGRGNDQPDNDAGEARNMKASIAVLATTAALSAVMLPTAPASAMEQCQKQRSVKDAHASTEFIARHRCKNHLNEKGLAVYGSGFHLKDYSISCFHQGDGPQWYGKQWMCLCSAYICRDIQRKKWQPAGELKVNPFRVPGRPPSGRPSGVPPLRAGGRS
jgi:hypothetical protein